MSGPMSARTDGRSAPKGHGARDFGFFTGCPSWRTIRSDGPIRPNPAARNSAMTTKLPRTQEDWALIAFVTALAVVLVGATLLAILAT